MSVGWPVDFEGVRAGGGPGSIAVEDALDGRPSWVTGAGDADAGEAVHDFVPGRRLGDAHRRWEALGACERASAA